MVDLGFRLLREVGQSLVSTFKLIITVKIFLGISLCIKLRIERDGDHLVRVVVERF